jgi:hypothetical protein
VISLPQGRLTGSTIGDGQTGQLTYTSSNGTGPLFTIVYQRAGGSNVTVTNVTSGVAFNVASGTPTRTTTYTLVSVTDQTTTASRTSGFTSGTATITNTAHYIGESFGGGIVFYITDGGNQGLIASTVNQSTGIKWYNITNTTTGATGTAVGTGLANTEAIIANQGATTTSYAAGLARNYVGGVYTDWYLPSKDELYLMYFNIGQAATPPNTNIGGFANANYWSSSEGGLGTAWTKSFNGGSEDNYFKNSNFHVRAIRSFDTRPQGSLTGSTIGEGQTGQLTYTSSNGGGPFTIVYQPAGGSNATVTNVTSGVAFNVASGTPTGTTNYSLVSVTDQTSTASRTSGFTTSTATITSLKGELVLYLDAGNNASYPGTGRTWYDLSGKNNNISFSATPTYSSDFGGIFTGMDGTNVVSSTLATTFSHNSFTIEWWINPSSVACCNNQISLNGATWTDFVSHMYSNNQMFVGFVYFKV